MPSSTCNKSFALQSLVSTHAPLDGGISYDQRTKSQLIRAVRERNIACHWERKRKTKAHMAADLHEDDAITRSLSRRSVSAQETISQEIDHCAVIVSIVRHSGAAGDDLDAAKLRDKRAVREQADHFISRYFAVDKRPTAHYLPEARRAFFYARYQVYPRISDIGEMFKMHILGFRLSWPYEKTHTIYEVASEPEIGVDCVRHGTDLTRGVSGRSFPWTAYRVPLPIATLSVIYICVGHWQKQIEIDVKTLNAVNITAIPDNGSRKSIWQRWHKSPRQSSRGPGDRERSAELTPLSGEKGLMRINERHRYYLRHTDIVQLSRFNQMSLRTILQCWQCWKPSSISKF
ncbi:hypothetical protein HO173_003255 [Letharia columbiana]|uniref:Uncharacterized protein n=1 Tax=Letharia columbiana TaxID=112416 RepID=A0A8H6G1F7_9LECA|nr:uncharacterized protein HO173_003255 [Letharia columbiana]KAF6238749.1 hypothetical protein HO173_003255 [Letharia columbiana]